MSIPSLTRRDRTFPHSRSVGSNPLHYSSPSNKLDFHSEGSYRPLNSEITYWPSISTEITFINLKVCRACSHSLWGPRGRCCPPGVCTSASAARSSHRLLEQNTKTGLLAKVHHNLLPSSLTVLKKLCIRYDFQEVLDSWSLDFCSQIAWETCIGTLNLTPYVSLTPTEQLNVTTPLWWRNADDVMPQLAAKQYFFHSAPLTHMELCERLRQTEFTLDSGGGCDRSSPID